ncbi:hypothetical protein TNCV_2216461 [Trichonephila clavipes]|nr:hypothetical protein TNCV_2216461 [Trichonephila clavipes]
MVWAGISISGRTDLHITRRGYVVSPSPANRYQQGTRMQALNEYGFLFVRSVFNTCKAQVSRSEGGLFKSPCLKEAAKVTMD